MSRTIHKPAHRRTRRTAERPFDYQPNAVPVTAGADPWDTFADPGLSRESRLAAAAFLGLTTQDPPTDAELAAAPCPHHDAQVRAELTVIANGF